jgi:hypothetical protein
VPRVLGKKEWKPRLTAAVDGVAYSGDHRLSNIREKLAKQPTSAGASLMPAEYVGKFVHKQNGTGDRSSVQFFSPQHRLYLVH